MAVKSSCLLKLLSNSTIVFDISQGDLTLLHWADVLMGGGLQRFQNKLFSVWLWQAAYSGTWIWYELDPCCELEVGIIYQQ